MEFGYFTLSDNHYDNNPRTPNQFVADITAEALYADTLGMNSAWIGEHHFNSLGVLSCPDLVLAYIAARTKHIRLAPAVTVLPLHHPIRVAEQWATLDLLSNGRVDFAAGRGYDKREYDPFHVSFADNQGIFEEGLELVRRLWSADGRISHKGQHYSFEDVRITPEAGAEADPDLCGVVLETLDRACRPARLRADRRAVRRRHELRRLEAGRRPLQRDLHQARQQARPADVQLLHAFRRHQGAGGGAARAPDPLLQGVRDPGVPGRSQDRAAELPLLHRDRRAPAQDQGRGPDREFGADRLAGADHRHPEKGRGRGLLRGDPLLQRGLEAARASQGRDGPVHARGRAGVRRRQHKRRAA